MASSRASARFPARAALFAGLCVLATRSPAPLAAGDPSQPDLSQVFSDQRESVKADHDAMRHRMQAAPSDCRRMGPLSAQVSRDQQGVVDGLLGARAHRVQHALWHAVRGGVKKEEGDQIAAAFGAYWGEDHPYCPPPSSDPDAPGYNPVGEDFLYMHREMIGGLNGALVAGKLACIAGWDAVPDPAQWPLPDGDRTGAKSD